MSGRMIVSREIEGVRRDCLANTLPLLGDKVRDRLFINRDSVTIQVWNQTWNDIWNEGWESFNNV